MGLLPTFFVLDYSEIFWICFEKTFLKTIKLVKKTPLEMKQIWCNQWFIMKPLEDLVVTSRRHYVWKRWRHDVMDHSCHAGTYPLKMARTDYILGCVTAMLPPIAEWGTWVCEQLVSPLPSKQKPLTRKIYPTMINKTHSFSNWENEQRCKTLPILYFTWPLSPYNAHIHRCRGRGQIVANRNHKQKNRNGSFTPSSFFFSEKS